MDLKTLGPARVATAVRPLLGLTVLVIEDSLFACEAMRLLCLRSGARIRRADTLASARRHLAVYRPTVVVIDVGLPDGSGVALISELAEAAPRIDVILGISGDPGAEAKVMAAGADGFIAKPIASLAYFQSLVLSHLPSDQHPPGPRTVPDEDIMPDRIAYHDDLTHVADVLGTNENEAEIDYIAQFLGGVARCAQDTDLHDAVSKLQLARSNGNSITPELGQVTAMVQDRLAARGPI